MSDKELQPAEREWLDYLRDIGFPEIYLEPRAARADEAATPSAVEAPRPQPRAEAPAVVEAPVAVEKLKAPAPEPQPRAAATQADAAQELRVLGERAAECTACRLSEGRQSVVFGSGSSAADLMLIGEGPGAEEDKQGLPFVGPAGALLTKILGAIGKGRDEVYIANMVKCRPPRNRDPQPDEIAACGGFLEAQIEIVRPKVIVALGRVAAQSLLGLDKPVGRMRGEWHTVHGIATRVTYHPAALLRNESYKRPTWEDMQIVRDRLAQGP